MPKLKIQPKDAHKTALKLIKNKNFKMKLKKRIADELRHKKDITRIDVLISKKHDVRLRKIYGLTKNNFPNITKVKLTSFNISPDGKDLAIYYKQINGNPAIRPLDNSKLAELLNILLKA